MKNSINLRGEALRSVMRQVPYPVTIVTAAAGDQIRGITIGSFTSLSMAPPLVSFNVERKAQMFPVLDKTGYFAVHIPGSDQVDLCNHFATPDLSGSEQFSGISYTANDHNTPILDEMAAVIHCRKYDLIEAGDHSIVVGEVMSVEQSEHRRSGIIYINQAFHEVGARLQQRSSQITD